MRNLMLKIAVPLGVISFGIFTKWWYALPIDAPDTMLTGFPWPYTCPGWHTSMSLQLFVAELIADLLTYCLFWFVLLYGIDRLIVKIKLPRPLTIRLWVICGLMIALGSVLALDRNTLFYVQRPFEMRVLDTGYRLIWQQIPRPDYRHYFP